MKRIVGKGSNMGVRQGRSQLVWFLRARCILRKVEGERAKKLERVLTDLMLCERGFKVSSGVRTGGQRALSWEMRFLRERLRVKRKVRTTAMERERPTRASQRKE